MPDPSSDLEAIRAATGRLVRSVDGLTDDRWAGPSLLPDWSRAHVVAHLALNAEALVGILRGLGRGEDVPMYPSADARDDDIEQLVGAGPGATRDRLLGSSHDFEDAHDRVPEEAWPRLALRTPTGPAFPVLGIAAMRRRELEIHHVDLDVGYGRHDWPVDFAVELLETVTLDHAGEGPFRIEASDLAAAWVVGGRAGGGPVPVVRGRAADLGWWLCGRGQGDGLRAESGTVPTLGPWRRTPGR